ncbi:MAG TPA: 3-phosphoserine/phosphohydroxythreonine transaminase [Lentisphaeria bacterium]|nr:MAG: phosphoserine transaminase [Lentisphaerae bacterium GWF2_49_21]HBC86182.1 3-phosphoserine/phosphohydroxythreonine transaminase [Lentisphaeria bacterium]
MRVFNFNPGPAMLPTEVMEQAQHEFSDYHKTGCGIMEHSHRGAEFTEVIETAEKNIRELMNIGDEYAVLFIQGGASLQFAMIPMNLHVPGTSMEYADTGAWSAAAIKEAKFIGDVKVVCSSKDTKYNKIPDIRHWKLDAKASYLHITSNNTIFGTQYHSFPDSKVPLIADMSSDFMSRVVDVDQFSLIYAGAQKNIGPSGVAVVIIKKELVKRTPANLPTMLKYGTYIDSNSLYNTPPTFGIYMIRLVTDWMKKKGGLAAIETINDAKSEALYETIEEGEFYSNPVEPASRSKMNVVFRLPSEALEEKFVKEAKAKGLIGLKGHRSVGGIRASIYNAMPLEGVEKLIDFMNAFEKANS